MHYFLQLLFLICIFVSTHQRKKSDDEESGGGCFHGDDYVVVENVGHVPISQLAEMASGTRVLTAGRDLVGKLQFSTVYYWIHAQRDTLFDFITLTTEHGHKLKLTPLHLIYTTTCPLSESHVTSTSNTKAVFAANLKLGQCLWVQNNASEAEPKLTLSKLIGKKVGKERGLYAPITETGNIIVNGVAASCFSNLENERLQRIMYEYMEQARRFLVNLWPYGNLADVFFSRQTAEFVSIPEVVWSFLDLSKKFVAL